MPARKPALIILTGHAPDVILRRFGDFQQWFRISAGLPRHDVRAVDVTLGEELPAPHEVSGVLITGSSSMVTERLAWSEHTAGWIRNAMDAELPMLGVCYGHQLMAHALGGRVDYLPGGREIGTVPIALHPEAANDPLSARLPASFRAHATHEQSVMELPRDSLTLAGSARDPYHLVRYGKHAVSTQFHPEFNADIMRAYIHRKRDALRQEGADPQLAFRQVGATPIARRLLKRFARHHDL